MKIGILTIHFGTNFGSSLQAYALTEYLNRSGHDAKIIHYVPERYNKILFSNVPKNTGKAKALVYALAALPIRLARRVPFNRFFKTYIPHTEKTVLDGDVPEFDVYIVGSDQVWNKDYNGECQGRYLLDFVGDGKKKVSYAASVGKKLDDMSEDELSELRAGIESFNGVSVREDSALDILERIGVEGQFVMDPTFLLDRDGWSSICKKRMYRDRYVLVYALDTEQARLTAIARKIADKIGARVCIVAFKKFKNENVDKCFTMNTPDEFVTLVRDAEFVVTNSFHGLAFSVNMQKQFVCVRRGTYNSRLESLLTLIGMNHRMCDEQTCLDLVDEVIDYSEINAVLGEKIKESERFLTESIKG